MSLGKAKKCVAQGLLDDEEGLTKRMFPQYVIPIPADRVPEDIRTILGVSVNFPQNYFLSLVVSRVPLELYSRFTPKTCICTPKIYEKVY